MPQVEVTFDVDANGILNVKAKDKTTNKEQSIRIEARSGLSDADIEKMKKDAELNAVEDKKKADLAGARNLAEQISYTAEKALADNGEMIPEDVRNEVREKIDALSAARKGEDATAITKGGEELSRAMQKIGEAMAKNPKNQSAGEQPKSGAGETVRDVDVEEKPSDTPEKEAGTDTVK